MSIQPLNTSNLSTGGSPYSVTASQRTSSTSPSTPNISENGEPAKARSPLTDTNLKRKEAEQAAQAMQEFIAPFNNSLKFSIDDDLGTVVIKVIDSSSDEVIKQIPSEEAIALAKALDKIKGLLVQQKA